MLPIIQRDPQHLLGCRHLQVQRQVDLGHQPIDIIIGNMAPVLAQVGGDPVSACLRRGMRNRAW